MLYTYGKDQGNQQGVWRHLPPSPERASGEKGVLESDVTRAIKRGFLRAAADLEEQLTARTKHRAAR